MSVELHWYASTPDYIKDYNSYAWLRDYKIYVWQPQLDSNLFPPRKVIIALSGINEKNIGTRNMMILLRPDQENTQLLPNLFHDERQKSSNAQHEVSSSLETEILTSILCLFDRISSDTRNFMKSLLNQIAILVSFITKS